MINITTEIKLEDLLYLNKEIDRLTAENKKLTETNKYLHKMNTMNYFEKCNSYVSISFSHLISLNKKDGLYNNIYHCCNFIRLGNIIIKDRDNLGGSSIGEYSTKIKFNDLDIYNKTLIIEKYCSEIDKGGK